MTKQRMDIGLVERRPVLDPVSEPLRHDAGIVGEFFGSIAIEPATPILQGLRQVPVIETKPRRNATRDQAIDQPVVEIEAAWFDVASARRQDAGPSRREAVGHKAATREQLDVVAPAVIMIAGDIAG